MKHTPLLATRTIAGIALLVSSITLSYDNEHFYRATNLFFEPRFAKKSLSSFDATIGYGSADESRPKGSSCECNDTCLLDRCGLHNMHEIGVGVPGKNLANPLDLLITNLALEPARDQFATFSIGGKFKITELNLSWMHNFTDHFFVHVHLPIRRLSVDTICFKDLSPTGDPTPNINSPIWQAFLTSFDAILKRYDLNKDPYKETAFGDLTAFLGWTYNFQDTQVLDFVDTTLRIGVIAPTGKTQNPDKIFALPHGHNDHIGVVFSADASFGACEWITLGAHIDATVFAKKTHCIRMKTGLQQSGLIYLAKGTARVDRGNHLVAGTYFKADHFARGLSGTIGYTFARKSSDKITPCDTKTFCPSIVNSNECLHNWKMHTLHLFFEYDFTKEDDKIGPRVGIFYNRQLAGKRVFKTNMIGGTVGVECMWEF